MQPNATPLRVNSPLSPSQAGATLISAVETKALPWIESNATDCIVIARPSYKEMKAAVGRLPDGVEISPRPLKSRRVIVRDRPEGFQFISARWPGDGVETKRFPMIGCTLRGSADLRVGDYIMHCREGHFILLPPGIPHPDASRVHFEGEATERRSCDILWFNPIGEVLRCWICRSENGKHSSLPSLYISQKKIVSYCNALFDEIGAKEPVNKKIQRGLLIAFLASVQNEIEEGRFFRWLPQTGAGAPEDGADPIKRAQNYIRQNFGERLTLERLARYTYMSRAQFAKRFHTETGETFTSFLTRIRLEEAKMRLTSSNAQIAALSRHVGLKPRHFTQIFQQSTGLTPSEYRRQHSSNPEIQTEAQTLAKGSTDCIKRGR